MDCKEALPFIHEYLDGDLEPGRAADLQAHLKVCRSCSESLRKWEHAEAMARISPKVQVPDDLTARIMSALPKPPRRRRLRERLKRHPALVTAAAFLLVMFASLLATWDQHTGIVVQGSDLDNVVIKGDTVLVPADRTVNGDLMVEHGKIDVEGQVKGNVVVVDGSLQLASTAYISGEVTQIDQSIDWILFKLRTFFGSLAPAHT